jgi:hypothetical protein
VSVTLVLSVIGNDSIWVVADRRLSAQNSAPRDDARKVMFIETDDGVGIAAYAGLGATVRGTEPADWMNAVLRGVKQPFESSLQALADAARKELPSHLLHAPVGQRQHQIVVPAFVVEEPRLYGIRAGAVDADFRFERWVRPSNGSMPPPLASIATYHGHSPGIPG